ncbi:NAD(P)-binding protein [Karstenula rhodostoma CBS 690.94]|uniref:NAD(P)-binding protein n=1 Tax=Karstenula rhodostoma CBS 690.94 TaxID=1392251 RepID=A0A9P4PX48_9PLEO|nr:NAD(P)-binding protein [Karstenula rhodostoma CBS 690.94]
MPDFTNRVILLTGGASGIGLATAHLLASRGAKVSLADANAEGLGRAEKEIRERWPGVEVRGWVVDVRDEEQVRRWVEGSKEVWGRVDGAANVAGVIGKSIGVKTVAEQDVDEWNFIMDINLKGIMLCMKHQLRHMSDNGAVVNASSIAGLQGRPRNAAYSASKHGVIGLTRSAAKEFGERGIRVNAVCPGMIDTPMSQAARIPVKDTKDEALSEASRVALGRKGKAEEVAELIIYLLSDGASFITGNAVSVDGGWQC